MGIKFSAAGTKLLSGVKTVFPGLLVSIVGGSFAFWMFNNPDKIRGKATLRAWESLKQYERLYTSNTDQINCGNIIEGAQRFKSNLLHQIQMTSENLKNILEKEGNVDNLMLAVVNMKIDSYNEMKKQTEVFLDTLISLDETSLQYQLDKVEFTKKWIQTYSSYMDECAYLRNRDTAKIHNILQELSKTYSINFSQEKSLPDLAKLRQSMIGNWSVALFNVSFGLKEDSTGYWNAYDSSFKCSWKLDSTTLKINLNDNAGNMTLLIERVTPDKIIFNQLGGEFKNNTFLACKTN
jgi:hypothetical protein